MQRLWITLGSLATAIALALTTFVVVSLIAHEEVTDVDTFAAADVAALDVGGDNGNIEIVGRDVDVIRVVAEVDHGLRRTSTTAEVRDRVLVVDNDCPTGPPIHCRVDYEIVVPRNLPVTVAADNGRVHARDLGAGLTACTRNGRLDVARAAGPVELCSHNGRIEARNLGSTEVSARTSNGRVDLSFSVAPQVVDARSRNGSIDIVVPETALSYRVHTDNIVGTTDTAVRTDPGSDRSITAETRNGSITVRYPTG